MFEHKVILIGESHHNGLGLARSFWMNGIKPYGIIVGEDAKNSFLRKSKSWEKTYTALTESDAVKLLIDRFSNENKKPVVIPWTDGAAATIDQNLDVLQKYFYVPSLSQTQGAIIRLMDKSVQIDFAKKYGLKTAKTWVLSLPQKNLPKDIVYPCILKPVISFEGKKSDITKCSKKEELLCSLIDFEKKGYDQILLQEYISFDYEIGIIGSCGDTVSYIITKKIRTWPSVGGTSSFMQVIGNENIHSICKSIAYAIKSENYNGLFDIDLFQKGNEVYLNEINWRNSGNSFLSYTTGVYYAVIWYMEQIGHSTQNMLHTSYNATYYAMNESTDLRHVIYSNLSPKSWIKDFRKTNGFAIWHKKDLYPTVICYLYYLKKVIFNKGFLP